MSASDRAAVHRPVALAVPALVEGDRGEPGRDRRPRVVVVALLARAGAVEDHDHAARAGGSGWAGSHSE